MQAFPFMGNNFAVSKCWGVRRSYGLQGAKLFQVRQLHNMEETFSFYDLILD
jgi:hypothetical protein